MIDIHKDFDAIVIGAGAAGLMAAIRGAERGARVLLLEKNRRPGVKILMSGGTRCNITNARGLRNLRVLSGPIDPAYNPQQGRGARSIQDAFGTGGKFLGPALRAFSVEDTVQFFEREGVATKIEGNGKIFPVSDRASDVLDALLRRLERTEAVLRCNAPVQRIDHHQGCFTVATETEEFRASKIVIAVGGQSFPGCGTCGDGYEMARRFGHTIVPTRPALVPLQVRTDWVPTLKGLTLPDVVASIQGATGPALCERREAILFAHFGLTGPAILDVSRAIARSEDPQSLDLVIDLVPTERLDALDQQLQAASRQGRKQVSSLLPSAIPRRLADALLIASRIPSDRVGPDLTREERGRLVSNIKRLRLPVQGTLGFGKAEVTSGGVHLDEVDSQTLESRLCSGLFFAGEVLDLDGLIGGYNFQGAWSMGWLVGESISPAQVPLEELGEAPR